MKTKLVDNKTFFKFIFLLAVPVMIQNMLTAVLNMVDTVMIGSLGEIQVAGVAIVNKLVELYIMTIYGLSSGISVFASQYYGVKDKKNINKLMGLSLTFVFVISLVFALVYFFFAPELIHLFIKDTKEVTDSVVSVGVSYMRIIVLSLLLTGVSMSFGSICRCVRNVRLPLYAALVGIGTNTILNYVLIFGKFGFDEMGVVGAAYATVIARILECVVILCGMFRKREGNLLCATVKDMFSWNKFWIVRVLRTSMPVLINDATYALANTTYVAIVGMLGASSVAIIQITSMINLLFTGIYRGIASAASVMIGNEIGRERYALAKEYAGRFFWLCVGSGFMLCIAVILGRDLICLMFNLEAETMINLNKSIIVAGVVGWLNGLVSILISGILRGGGDTKICMYTELFSMWLLGVPAVLIAVVFFEVPVYIAMSIYQIDNITKITFLYFRYRSMKWINHLI